MAGLALKEEGNMHYRAGRYREAEDCYTRALAEPGAPPVSFHQTDEPRGVVLAKGPAPSCMDWPAGAAQSCLTALPSPLTSLL